MKTKIDTIIFDLGGVLVDWNPKYIYRKVFNYDEDKVQWFLNTICTSEWNVEQDGQNYYNGNVLIYFLSPNRSHLKGLADGFISVDSHHYNQVGRNHLIYSPKWPQLPKD